MTTADCQHTIVDLPVVTAQLTSTHRAQISAIIGLAIGSPWGGFCATRRRVIHDSTPNRHEIDNEYTSRCAFGHVGHIHGHVAVYLPATSALYQSLVTSSCCMLCLLCGH